MVFYGTSVVFDRVGVPLINVRALEVLAPSEVAFSRSAVPPRLVSSIPRCVWPVSGVVQGVVSCIPVPWYHFLLLVGSQEWGRRAAFPLPETCCICA